MKKTWATVCAPFTLKKRQKKGADMERKTSLEIAIENEAREEEYYLARQCVRKTRW